MNAGPVSAAERKLCYNVLGRAVRGGRGVGAGEGEGEGEAEDVVAHAGLFGGFLDCSFEAAIDEAAEEDFVFGAFVRH